MVDPLFRQQKIAQNLLALLIKHLKNLEINFLFVKYPDYETTNSIFIHLLKKFNFEKPQPLQARFYFTPVNFTPFWLDQDFSPSSSFSLISWEKTTAFNQEKALRWHNQNPLEIPFPEPSQRFLINALNSFTLYHHEELIGWLLTVNLTPQLLLYSSFFITPRFSWFKAIFSFTHSIYSPSY